VAAPARALGVALLLITPRVLADERFDHRGSLGLIVAGDYSGVDSIGLSVPKKDEGLRYVLDLGATRAIGYDGNEVLGMLSLGFDAPTLQPVDLGVAGGYRGYFGSGRIKTFVDLDLSAHALRLFTVGPRVGIGAQWEIASVLGVFFGLIGELGIGTVELRYSAQLTLGFQPRTYLLE